MRAWWARIGAISGLVSVVVSIASFAAAPQPPGWDANVRKIEQFLAAHRTGLEAGQLLTALSGLLLLLFVVFLWSKFRGEGEVTVGASMLVLAGGAAAVAIGWVQNAVILTLTLTQPLTHDGGVRLFFSLADVVGYFVLFAFIVFLAGAALAIVETSIVPPWLGWAAAIIAAALLVLASAGFFHPSVSTSATALVAYLVLLLWLAVVSILLTRIGWRKPPVVTPIPDIVA
jgi:hypothetical protein